jgi:hypothetical protein
MDSNDHAPTPNPVPASQNGARSLLKPDLFFLHIPKTAGTSLVDAIKQYFLVASPLDYNFPDLEARLAVSDFVWGHISLHAFRQVPGFARFRVAVIIRHPFARLASHLQFADRYNEPSFAEDFHELPDATKVTVRELADVDFGDANAIGAFLRSTSRWGRAAFDNCQVQFLTDTPRPPDYIPRSCVTGAQIKEAVASLETFDFLGITEDLFAAIADISNVYGRDIGRVIPESNVGHHGRRVNWRDPAIRDAMSPLLHGDLAVYRRAKELLERRRTPAELGRIAETGRREDGNLACA